MAVLGQNFPAAAAVEWYGGSVTTWTSPGDALTYGGYAANAGFTAPGSSDWLILTGYGFAVPPDCEVTDVAVHARASNGTGDPAVLRVKLQSTGIGVGTEKDSGQLPYVWADAVFAGGPSYWGIPLTAAVVNDPSFGVRVRAVTEADGMDVKIDTVTVAVTYDDGYVVTGSFSLHVRRG